MKAANARRWEHHELKAVFGDMARHHLPEFDKPAGKRCPLQQHHKGCSDYARRPMGCVVWSCRWLVSDDTQDLSRPDRSGYVLDMTPDFVVADPNDGNEPVHVQVIQIWVDPGRPHAHRDPKLRAYLERQAVAETAKLGLVRYTETKGLLLIPPSWSSDGAWHEFDPGEATLRTGATWPGQLGEIEREMQELEGLQVEEHGDVVRSET